jgi:hypothetical protein
MFSKLGDRARVLPPKSGSDVMRLLDQFLTNCLSISRSKPAQHRMYFQDRTFNRRVRDSAFAWWQRADICRTLWRRADTTAPVCKVRIQRAVKWTSSGVFPVITRPPAIREMNVSISAEHVRKSPLSGCLRMRGDRAENRPLRTRRQGNALVGWGCDLPLALQPELLRVLREQEFERLGGCRRTG